MFLSVSDTLSYHELEGEAGEVAAERADERVAARKEVQVDQRLEERGGWDKGGEVGERGEHQFVRNDRGRGEGRRGRGGEGGISLLATALADSAAVSVSMAWAARPAVSASGQSPAVKAQRSKPPSPLGTGTLAVPESEGRGGTARQTLRQATLYAAERARGGHLGSETVLDQPACRAGGATLRLSDDPGACGALVFQHYFHNIFFSRGFSFSTLFSQYFLLAGRGRDSS
jgi:hypothetical protein